MMSLIAPLAPCARALLLASLVAIVGCATTAPAHRGADADAIHGAAVAVAEGEGFTCTAAPDKSYYDCTHPELTDFSFAYLSSSNLLQVWARFRRDDDGLVEKWRTGSCDAVAADVARINNDSVVKLVCAEDHFRFEVATWVPEQGLVADDLSSLFRVFRMIVSENIQGGGFLPPAAPADGAAPADADGTGV